MVCMNVNYSFIKFSFSLALIIFLTFIAFTFSFREYILNHPKIIDEHYWLDRYVNNKIKKSYNIAIILPSNFSIEHITLSEKITKTCESLSWKSTIIPNSDNIEEKIRQLQPDFILTFLTPDTGQIKKIDNIKMYAYLLEPSTTYFGGTFNLIPKFKSTNYGNLKSFDGFLVAFKNIESLQDYIESQERKFYGIISHPSFRRTKFNNIKHDKVIYIGASYEKLKSSNKYKIMFNKLDQNNLINIYGPKEKWEYISKSWRGFIPFNQPELMVNKTSQHGISLILHKRRDLYEEIPSSQIFEAIAANSIVISENNNFLKKHFDDNILYFNPESSADRIYKEIVKHIGWIKQNPELVQEKAKKAHEIFIKNFSLEMQLTNIAKMHEQIMKMENN
jgi:hypothetical protein